MFSRTAFPITAPWRGALTPAVRHGAGRPTLVVSPDPGVQLFGVRGRPGAGLALLGWWTVLLALFLVSIS